MSRQSDIMWFQLQNICVKLIVLLTFACRSGLHICMWPHNVAQTMQSSAHILSGTSGFVLHGFPLWSQFQRNRNATFKTIVCFWLRIFLGEGPEYDNADWHAQSQVKWHAFLIWSWKHLAGLHRALTSTSSNNVGMSRDSVWDPGPGTENHHLTS